MADEPESAEATGRSTRTVALLSIAAILLVAIAVVVASCWPQIQLRYHRYYFRRGTPAQQLLALKWMVVHRLEKDMSKERIEKILGEPLERRFSFCPDEMAPWLKGVPTAGYSFRSSASRTYSFLQLFFNRAPDGVSRISHAYRGFISPSCRSGSTLWADDYWFEPMPSDDWPVTVR